MTIDEYVEECAIKLEDAALIDSLTLDEEYISQNELRHSKIVKELLRISRRIHELDEDDFDYFVIALNKRLGFRKPKRLRRILSERSMDSFMAMASKIEDLLNSLRK